MSEEERLYRVYRIYRNGNLCWNEFRTFVAVLEEFLFCLQSGNIRAIIIVKVRKTEGEME